MTKKKVTTQDKFVFKGFENLEFTEAERNAVGSWIDSITDDPFDCIVVLVEAQYKVGLSYSEYHSVNQISATCKDKSSPYFGYCFTFRHSDVRRGLLAMRYIYDSLLAEELYELKAKQNEYDW